MSFPIAKSELVAMRGSEPFTTSLAIADGVGLDHRVVIRLVRKHQGAFGELGTLNFESSKSGGRKTEFAVLNEDHATFLMTLFRNSDAVLVFKLRLVKAFRKARNELARLKRQQAVPAWRLVRDESALAFKWMTESLQESRAAAGKETLPYHFANEARMVNRVLAGRFGSLNRDELSGDALATLALLQRRDALLLVQGKSYRERRAALELLINERVPSLVSTSLAHYRLRPGWYPDGGGS